MPLTTRAAWPARSLSKTTCLASRSPSPWTASLPGLSVAVAADGELVWAEGFGFADVRRRAPVTPLTKFRLGSVSKTLTAAAVALLHDRGRIDFDAPVQTYVPSYPHTPWPITTRQLLGDIASVRVSTGH
jgi:serine beta-lactamase-like protein LACTB, mitochondrial